MRREAHNVEGIKVSSTAIIELTDDGDEASRLHGDVCNAMLQEFLDSPDAVEQFLEDFSMRIERLNANPMFRRRLAQDVMKQVDFRTRIVSEMIASWSVE